MDADGEKEVILHVISAGDDGGKVILHRIDEEICAYITDNRHLWDLKEDGTYGYALMGNSNDGYAMIKDFLKDTFIFYNLQFHKIMSAYPFEIRHIYRGIKKERREVLCVDSSP